MTLVAQQDREIGQKLAAELAGVEGRFSAELLSDLPCVNDLVAHVEQYRGKMLRPMLVLLGGIASAPNADSAELTDDHRVIAAVAEMVHMATLVHDDVLDGARVRRRGGTVNHLHGNETAVMLGDYLISHAYHLCSSLESTAASRIIADATNVVCEGELLQLANRNNWALDEATYFEIIRRKTASLCGTCCRLGALLHSEPLPGAADALYDFGEKVGIAFQIIDDVLDLTGSPDTVGKTLGLDLEKGKLTLPLIHHLGRSDPAQRESMIDELRHQPHHNGRGGRHVNELVTASGSVAYASERAGRLVADARRRLDALPDSPARRLLADMADSVLTRRF